MREKDSGEKLLDEALNLHTTWLLGDLDPHQACSVYQLAGEVVNELETLKEENMALKKRIVELESEVK